MILHNVTPKAALSQGVVGKKESNAGKTSTMSLPNIEAAGFMPALLLIMQRLHRIYSRRTIGRNETSRERNQRQYHRGRGEDRCVIAFQLVEQRLRKMTEADSSA